MTIQIILIIIFLKLSYLSNHPVDYFPPVNIESFFITLTDGSKAFNIISSLKLNKNNRPNCFPTKS